MIITPEMKEIIEKALRKGDCVELKKERDNLVIVQIHREVRIKQNMNTPS